MKKQEKRFLFDILLFPLLYLMAIMKIIIVIPKIIIGICNYIQQDKLNEDSEQSKSDKPTD